MFTRLSYLGWSVIPPDNDDEFWARAGRDLSGNEKIYEAIMTAEPNSRAKEFSRLLSYNWNVGNP